jgi:hypothetical protein
MQWLEKARAIVHGTHGLPLPDPDRLDIGSVPDTALLMRAIDAAMPRTAILQLIGPRHKALLPFLARRSIAMRRSAGEYLVSLEDGGVAELARVAAGCAPNEVCSHLIVQDGNDILLEAFGRDRGEDVVWLSSRVPRARLRRFLEVIAGAPRAAPISRPLGVTRQPRPDMVLLR